MSTDENGLYYMRQRYYNPEIKRFINQDILTGSLSDSQSLNRYSYVQGNPVSYTDPFGLSPIKSLFTNGNLAHSILGLASNIPGIGIVASLIDAGLYFGEGNMVMFGACLVDAALGFVPFGAGYLIKMGSKSVRLLNVVIKGSKLVRNMIDFGRNVKNFAFSAADFYIRHEGTFFTNDFKWGLADVGDIMSMAMSGTGMLQSGAGIYKSVTDLSAFLYASGIKADIKNALGRLKNGIKNTVADIKDGFQSVVHNARMRMYRVLQASSAGKGGSGATFEGTIYRSVNKQYNPLEMSQYTINSNHRYTEKGVPGLYFSSGEKIVKAELGNYDVTDFSNRIMYSYDVKLTNMLDVSNPSIRKKLGVSLDSIVGESYDVTHAIGRYAYSNGYNGIIAPSARTDGGVNIIIFNTKGVK